ncbi:MAG: tetratricopeptide repeat protein [Nitrospinae bacterium]|nr:tetratricopeptide repeat protein [Nitrospinota bacterium]
MIDYNLGGAYFKTGKFDDAVKAYGRALASDDPALRERAAFNQGAALLGKGEAAMKAGDMQTARGALERSAERYRGIVRHDKTNADARRNLELALVRLRELEELPPQEKNEDQRGDDQQPKGKNKEQTQPAPEPQVKQGGQQQQAEQPQPEKGKGKERRPAPGEMTKEEARMILNAIEQDEAEVKRGAREKMMGAAEEEKVEKDW